MEIFKERIPCNCGRDVRCNFLEVTVSYDIGGYSYFTCQTKKRGYYLSVSPIEVWDHCVSYQAFSGTYMLLNEVKRQSKNGEKEALRLLPEHKQRVIDYVCNEHGITLKETA